MRAVLVSRAGWAEANGLYTPTAPGGGGALRGAFENAHGCALRRCFPPTAGCDTREFQGWGILCNGHHRYVTRGCDAPTPLACADWRARRTRLSALPVPHLADGSNVSDADADAAPWRPVTDQSCRARQGR